MAEGEDLYDDLYEDVGDMLLPKTALQIFQKSEALEEEFKKKEEEFNARVEPLLKELEELRQANAVLTRNISCLFKTAQMELARKDKQMKELRDENLRFKLGGTRGPTNVRPHLNTAVPVDQSNERGLRGQTSQCHVSPKTTTIVDSAHEHRQSSAEGKKFTSPSPSRGLLSSSKQRDESPDGTKRTADENFDSSIRPADHGHTRYRSPERHRDSGHDRSRDRRVDVSLRNSDSRKRHRSVSRERDVTRPESLRGSKAINRSHGSESSRERQRDQVSSRHHR